MGWEGRIAIPFQVIGKPVYLVSNLLGRYVGLICAGVKGVILLSDNAIPFWGFLPNPIKYPGIKIF